MIRAASRLSEIYRFGFWILIVAVVVGSIHYPPLIGFQGFFDGGGFDSSVFVNSWMRCD